jgi:hypothetical protein
MRLSPEVLTVSEVDSDYHTRGRAGKAEDQPKLGPPPDAQPFLSRVDQRG